MTARCPSFHQCIACQGCTKYDPHDIACAICESRKPADQICDCKEEHRLIVRYMNEKTKQLMFHPDKRAADVDIDASSDNEWEKINSGLSEFNKYGRIEK